MAVARLIETIISTANGCTKQFYTAKDIVDERQKLHNKATAIFHGIKDENIRHIVYYRDERSESGDLKKAYFNYDLIGLTDAQFYDKWDKVRGVVGAVHRRGNI